MAAKQNFQILVTGGSGFLGRAIIEDILKTHPQWRVSALDIRPPRPEVERKLERFFNIDITSTDSVAGVFDDYVPDLLFHTAGIIPARRLRYSTKTSDWERVQKVNVDGTRNVLQASLAAGCKRFVYTSSVTLVIDDLEHDYYYMNEESPIGTATLHYGRSKGIAEAYVLSPEHAERGLKACALRPCTIIGPEDTQVISVIHDLIAKNETRFIIGDGNNVYDWMYIDNAVDAHVLTAENLLSSQTAAGHAFFITNQEPAYFWDFLAFIWAQFGHVPPYRIHISASLALMVGFLFEFITWLTGKPTTLDTGSVRDGIRVQYADNSKAVRILGYVPKVGLAEGVRRSCEGYKRQLAAREAGPYTNGKAR